MSEIKDVNNINRDKFTRMLSEKLGKPITECKVIYDAFVKTMEEVMVSKDRLIFKGVLRIEPKMQKPRNLKHPVTGKPTQEKPFVVLRCRVSHKIKKKIK